MSLYDDLSRLLDDELPPEQAAALRERIANDPEVAGAWSAMKALPTDLAALPEIAPPPGLDAAVLAARAPQETRRRLPSWAPWALAAAMALIAIAQPLVAPAQPEILLVEGGQRIEGRAVVRAAAATVEVDGRADIFVEPPAGLPRGDGGGLILPENEPMKSITAALAGAAVTVAVYEGAALVRGADAAEAPVVVEAGETRQFGQAPAADAPVVARSAVRRPAGETSPEAQAYIDELESRLEALEVENDFNKGQLAAFHPQPVEWPADLPGYFEPEAYADAVRGAVLAHPGWELVSLDCAEYPCIALLDGPDAEDWSDQVADIAEHITAGYDGEVNNSDMVIQAETKEDTFNLAAVTIWPGDGSGEETIEVGGPHLHDRVRGIIQEEIPELGM